MTANSIGPALILSMAKALDVPDLIRTAETLRDSGQLGLVLGLYATWIEHHPNHPLLFAVLFNYSVVLSDNGKLTEARECLQLALRNNPDFIPGHINLGRIHERLGNPSLAVIAWSIALTKMVAVDGQAVAYKTTALNQSARALEAMNQDDAAEQLLSQSLALDNQQHEVIQHLVALRQRQCEWPVIVPQERASHVLQMKGLSPLSAAALTDDPLYQLGLAYHYNLEEVSHPTEFAQSWPLAETSEKPLRIGYLSSDLREHAVGFLMTEVLKLHDRSRVRVFVYYCGPETSDPLYCHFRNTADSFLSITQLDDKTAAKRIADDGIQILVDLNGYTREARLKLVGMRPAPVIVNWLGFPGTMASPYHHYLIADDTIIPRSHEPYYTERVMRLPCYQPNNRTRNVADTKVTRQGASLPEDAMVYCCFNGAHKITRFTFERWLMILSQVPKSVLWLMSSIESVHERLRTFAVKCGIEQERIIFADKLPNAAHLERYPLADLFLDCAPYGAHTTASDALYMGVPVLTYVGRSFASRVCASLVNAAGLPDLVCESAEQYVDAAIALGNDRPKLLAYREHLSQNRTNCVLFDTPLLVKELENLYLEMWNDYQQGKRPQPKLQNLDILLELGAQENHETLEIQNVPDYQERYRNRLLRRHQARPIIPDPRLAELGLVPTD